MSVSEVETIDVQADDGEQDVPVPASDYHTQREIYEKYLPIVRRIAMRTVRSLPPSVTIDDVISAGWLGMVEALGRRTPDMTDDHFEAFASYRVRGAILDHLRMLDPMSRKLRGASRRITQVAAELVGRLGRAPEQEEVAAELGMPLADYHKLLTEISEAGAATDTMGERASLEASIRGCVGPARCVCEAAGSMRDDAAVAVSSSGRGVVGAIVADCSARGATA